MHRHNGTDYQHANDCPYCWREASDIQSATIERLSSKLAEKERECEQLYETLFEIRSVLDEKLGDTDPPLLSPDDDVLRDEEPLLYCCILASRSLAKRTGE